MKYFILLLFMFFSWANHSYNVWEWAKMDLIIIVSLLGFATFYSVIEFLSKKS